MATQEFYIRAATETDARGPFTLEQLTSLAEAGQVTPSTLYYDAATEQWAAIDSNPEVRTALFPDKKRLRVKPKEMPKSGVGSEKASTPITVDDMLAAAEGNTSDTRDRSDPLVNQLRAARLGMWALIFLLLISAASLILSKKPLDLLIKKEFVSFALHPYAILGVLDLFFALMLVLQMVSMYSLIRFRIIFGLGFLGFIFWGNRDIEALIALSLASVGMYLCTVFVSYLPLAIAVAAGFAGMAGFAFFMLN